MLSGTVVLSRVYEFVHTDPEGRALLGTSPAGRKYGRLAKELAAAIPPQRGCFMLGRYMANRSWESIFIGHSTLGHTSHLQARILELLKDHRMIFWRATMSRDELLAKSIENGYGHYHGGDDVSFDRTLSRAGTTHVLWVSMESVDSELIGSIAADLVEAMNPTANAVRHTPPSNIQGITAVAIAEFRMQIHKHRPDD